MYSRNDKKMERLTITSCWRGIVAITASWCWNGVGHWDWIGNWRAAVIAVTTCWSWVITYTQDISVSILFSEKSCKLLEIFQGKEVYLQDNDIGIKRKIWN